MRRRRRRTAIGNFIFKLNWIEVQFFYFFCSAAVWKVITHLVCTSTNTHPRHSVYFCMQRIRQGRTLLHLTLLQTAHLTWHLTTFNSCHTPHIRIQIFWTINQTSIGETWLNHCWLTADILLFVFIYLNFIQFVVRVVTSICSSRQN